MNGFVVFAAPYTPPAPEPPPWVGFGLQWTGWNGAAWNLLDPEKGLTVLRDSVVGLHFPPFEPITSPRLAGRRRRGVRVRERTLEFSLLIWHDRDTDAWLQRDTAFWRSFHPERAGELAVTSPSGDTRTVRAYLESDGGYGYQQDPAKAGWALYPVVLTAEDPFWLGEPITEGWKKTEPRLLFGGGLPSDPGAVELAPPLFISSDASLELAEMGNPGDVAAWPLWTIAAAAGADVELTITNAGGLVGAPTVPAGRTVTIDVDPERGTAILDDGTDLSGQVNPYDPRPIPDGTARPIGFEMIGIADVSATIRPRYFRAF